MTAEAPADAAALPGGGGPQGGPARAVDWLRRNLFSSVANTLLTLLVLALLWLVVPSFFEWAITHATVAGDSKDACTGDGACWTFIKLRLLTVFPLLAGILLVGGVAGLPFVDTSLWGGLMLDVIISFVTVAGALPLGILLAIGRRSQLPVIRYFSIGFIELWRGVPLLTVLFMSAVMVPLFLPYGVSIDRLIRAMVAFTLFNAAYMAETVRGGLQGVPIEQEEAAYSVGLKWWQVQVFVTLPQALRIVVPGIVNNIVDLFKDTSLVTIIGLADLLGAVNQSLKDPAWLGLAKEGYVFTAFVFFVCCFGMSSYSRRFERRLNRHRTGAI